MMDFGAAQSNDDGYDFTDDVNHVLGPITDTFPVGQTGQVDSAAGFRDPGGHIAFPGRYEGNGAPSFRPEAGPRAAATGPEDTWPRKNEDGSYQIAPGARIEFKPVEEDTAKDWGNLLIAGSGILGGAIGSVVPGYGTTIGALAGTGIGYGLSKPLEHVLKTEQFPRIVIGDRIDHHSLGASDYPSQNRNE